MCSSPSTGTCIYGTTGSRSHPPEDASFNCGIKLHHILAASDDFNKLSMYWDLMPAAKLNYVHDFRGYFNCILQVVYFHDQEYERKPQVSFLHAHVQTERKKKCKKSSVIGQNWKDAGAWVPRGRKK